MEISELFSRFTVPQTPRQAHDNAITSDESIAPLLIQIGFACLNMGRIREAGSIFYATKTVWPQRLGPRIGLAVTCIQSQMYDMAIDILKEAQEEHKNDPAIEAFLGLTYFYKEDFTKAKTILQSIPAKQACISDSSVFAMANSLLDELNNKGHVEKSALATFS